jgi:hypothetical protein
MQKVVFYDFSYTNSFQWGISTLLAFLHQLWEFLRVKGLRVELMKVVSWGMFIA